MTVTDWWIDLHFLIRKTNYTLIFFQAFVWMIKTYTNNPINPDGHGVDFL